MRAHTRIPLYAKKQIDLPDPPGTFLIAVRAPTPSSNVEDDVDGTGQDLWDVSEECCMHKVCDTWCHVILCDTWCTCRHL
jgi:hypothetical protein